MSIMSVGSATTSQQNGLAISVVSADSNKLGAAPGKPAVVASHPPPNPPTAAWLSESGQPDPLRLADSLANGGAWRPGQGAHIIRSRSLIRLLVNGAPRAPQGNNSSQCRSECVT